MNTSVNAPAVAVAAEWQRDASCAQRTDLFWEPLLDYDPADHDWLQPLDPTTGAPLTVDTATQARDTLREQARAVCATCPVLESCTVYALSQPVTGVAAGFTGDELQRLRRSSGVTLPTLAQDSTATAVLGHLPDVPAQAVTAQDVAALVDALPTLQDVADALNISVRTVARLRARSRENNHRDEVDAAPADVSIPAAEVPADLVDLAVRVGAAFAGAAQINVNHLRATQPAGQRLDNVVTVRSNGSTPADLSRTVMMLLHDQEWHSRAEVATAVAARHTHRVGLPNLLERLEKSRTIIHDGDRYRLARPVDAATLVGRTRSRSRRSVPATRAGSGAVPQGADTPAVPTTTGAAS